MCEVGIAQISKAQYDYHGPSGWFTEYQNNHDWRVDGPIPYAIGVGNRPTSDDPFSQGRLAMYDNPAAPKGHPVSYLHSARIDFETCVVAIRGEEGREFRTLPSYASVLSKMAVYGCLTWGYGVLRQPDGTYVVTRWLMDQITSNDDTALVISEAGRAPSDDFKSALETFYRVDPLSES